MRPSRHINIKPASNLKQAIQHAAQLGLPLTHFVSVNFTLTHCPPEQACEAFERLRDNHFCKWVRRPSRRNARTAAPPAYAFVFENPHDVLNLHWAVHVPRPRWQEFESKAPEWLERVTGGPLAPGACHIRLIDDPGFTYMYMLKGANPLYLDLLKLRFEDQGTVHGQRSGVSRSLNRAARKRAGINGRRYTPFRPPSKK